MKLMTGIVALLTISTLAFASTHTEDVEETKSQTTAPINDDSEVDTKTVISSCTDCGDDEERGQRIAFIEEEEVNRLSNDEPKDELKKAVI